MAVDDPIFSSNALAIAVDVNYDVHGDAYDGSAIKVEPSAGEIAQGVVRPGEQIAAQHVNWVFNQFSQILSALIANAVDHEDRLDDDEAELLDHENRITVAESWINDTSPRIKIIEHLVSGSEIVPARCSGGFSYSCGGGGAGGGGKIGIVTVDRWISGGAGGGGSYATLLPLRSLVPGESLTVTVGAGGLALTNTLGGTGNNGGDTIVSRGATPLAVHHGATGGRGSIGAHTLTYWVHHTYGGPPVRDINFLLIGPSGQGIRWDSSTANPFGKTADGGPHSLYIPMMPGQGGCGSGGSTGPASQPGAKNLTGGFAGGAAGVKGPDGRWDPAGVGYVAGYDTRRGGGGGGGGGAGPFGPGAAGGNGQYGDLANSPYRTQGYNAGANTGAGGGGGGSGGYSDDVEDVGGYNSNFGGDGGSGRCYLIFVQESGT